MPDVRVLRIPSALRAVETAALAPSMHNSQPWRFRLRDDTIEIHVDPDRVPALGDPTWRGARIACGAALFNLRLALRAQELTPIVSVCPKPAAPTLVARVGAGEHRPANPEERELFAAIPKRHSNRYPFLSTPVPVEHRARLRAAAQKETGWLDFLLGPAAIDTIGELVRLADRTLTAEPAYRAEVASWTRYGGKPAPDGVPEAAAGPAPRPWELLARRAFGTGRPSAREYEAEPTIGVLGSLSDSPADQVAAGQALQRVLLTLTRYGLVASLLSQPIELPVIREELRIGLGRYGPPQIVLRIGYGTAGATSSRRPVEQIVDVAGQR
jgi:nitroreductase